MKKTVSRPERRLLWIAHRLKDRSRSVALLYLDSFQGDRLGLAADTKRGFVGLHLDQRQKRAGIELLCTSSSSATSLAADLVGCDLPRKQMNTRRFVKRVEALSNELASTFDKRAIEFPHQQLDRLLGLFPSAMMSIGLVSDGRKGRSQGDGFDHATVHGAFIPAGEVGVFVSYDVSLGGFRVSRGASILVAETLTAHSVEELGGFGVILEDASVLQPREDGAHGLVDNVVVGVGEGVVEGALNLAGAPVEAALDAIDLGLANSWDCMPDCDCAPDCGCDVPCV